MQKMTHVITPLTHLGLLRIAGTEAKKFLQGQLTCNLDDISPIQSQLGAHCNPQGRIISFFRLFIFADCYYLQMPRELIPIATKALQKYAVFFKVALTDASLDFTQIGYCRDDLPNMPKQVNEQVSSDQLIIIRVIGNPARYLLIGTAPNLSIKSCTINEWQQQEIIHKIPAIYPSTTEKFLPHDLNLTELKALSFAKGCYTGQEIIARMEYRGKPKTHLYRATVRTISPPSPGHDIYSTKQSSGHIVDFAQIDYNYYDLLVTAQETDRQTPLFLDADMQYRITFLE